MTRVLLVDDHALIRRGLRDALGDAGVGVAGEAGCWDELQPLLDTRPFDVLLLDIQLPGPSGLEILQRLGTRPQRPRALVLSMYPEDPYALKALEAGAQGYVAKSSDTTQLVEAIARVARGERSVSDAIARLLASAATAGDAGAPHERLSPREQMLLVMLAQGVRLPEIAERLALPPRTVSVYRARLLEKMKLAGNAELAHYAARHRLLGASPIGVQPG
ncbi:MAG TPA: response regulator transcription factor [Ramlibacter sp.]|jgi:DNA-binding NarL/FixJ family response regulator|uniref:response regulator transcription factor n=1 Tax=Ramlibacter sp. TaxID=1917967 RepID=UPI002D3DEEB2|nr:response regulator transcription factor [Ramlibacter sp.]HZY19178.1 response regulator transcription factor [Ramlibacter sp.]